MQSLSNVPTTLLTNSRIGEQLFEFEQREIQRIFVGTYEVRYEIQKSTTYVLRLWHTHEHRLIKLRVTFLYRCPFGPYRKTPFVKLAPPSSSSEFWMRRRLGNVV